jgi:hypothetical protein
MTARQAQLTELRAAKVQALLDATLYRCPARVRRKLGLDIQKIDAALATVET